MLPSLEVVAVAQAPSPESNTKFSFTRHCHGGSIPYHRKRTGQKLGRLVTKSDQQFIRNHQEHNRRRKEREVRVWYVM